MWKPHRVSWYFIPVLATRHWNQTSFSESFTGADAAAAGAGGVCAVVLAAASSRNGSGAARRILMAILLGCWFCGPGRQVLAAFFGLSGAIIARPNGGLEHSGRAALAAPQ